MATVSSTANGVAARTRRRQTLIRLEGVALLLAAPFLLFPELLPPATLAALVILALVWSLPLVLLRDPLLPATPFNTALLLFSLMVGVGVLATADPATTLDKATGVLLGLAVWRFLTIAVATRGQFQQAFAVLVALAFGLALVGFLGIREIPKIPAFSGLLPAGGPLPALGALAVHPNQLAGLICFYLPALLSVLAGGRKDFPRAGRLLLIGVAGVSAAILVLTQSRGGWIGLLAGLFILLALWGAVLGPTRGRRVVRLAALVMVVAGVVLALEFGPQRMRAFWSDPPRETVVGDLSTLNYRKELWPWAVTAVGDFPLTGVGLGAFRAVAFRLYPLALSSENDFGHAHNIMLQMALDVGLPGLVAYLAVLLLCAAVGWRAARRDPFFRPYALGILAGLAALHVYGIADALALGSKPGLVLWYVLGLLTVMSIHDKTGGETTAGHG